MRCGGTLLFLAVLGAARPASALIGASVDTVDPAVVHLLFVNPADPMQKTHCTGTLITPRVVLTAAFCLRDAITGNYVQNGLVHFGTNVDTPTATIPIADHRTYRLYDAGYGDLAVVLLTADGPVAPAMLNEADLAPLFVIGTTEAVQVGYGASEMMPPSGFVPQRRSVDLIARTLGARTFASSEDGKGTCPGDSGGPSILVVGADRWVVGVTGEAPGCNQGAVGIRYRVDAYLDEFIYPAIDAWEGPCRLDSACVTAGCRTPDPDCDPCGPDGTCTAECPTPDWDCPVDGVIADPCTDPYDCESRLCQPATEDPRVMYCTEQCDPTLANTCPTWMACTAVGSDHVCVYSTITPRTQGAQCVLPSDCRSEMCDLVDQICVEPCDLAAGDAACPAGFECNPSSYGQDVCRYPQPGHGFCETATRPGRGSPTAWSLLAAGLVLAIAYARRRRRAGT